MPAHHGDCRAPRSLAIVEDCCQAHLATCDGRAGRHDGDAAARSASIRRRTSGRSATAAPSSPTTPRWPTHPAPAQRRPDRSLSSTSMPASTAGSTNCRRRSCARGCPALGWTTRAARARGAYPRRQLTREVRAAPERDAGHVYHLFPSVRDRAQQPRRAAGASARAGHRNVDSLPGAAAPSAGVRRRSAALRDVPGGARSRRARCCRCRCIRG